MISFGDEYNIIVLSDCNFVKAAIVCIHPLNGKSLRLVCFVKINFFQTGFLYPPVFINFPVVMFMRGERTPVSGRGIDLDADQSVTIESRRDQAVDLPGGVITSPDLNRTSPQFEAAGWASSFSLQPLAISSYSLSAFSLKPMP
jgi:hypothetical protein